MKEDENKHKIAKNKSRNHGNHCWWEMMPTKIYINYRIRFKFISHHPYIQYSHLINKLLFYLFKGDILFTKIETNGKIKN